MTQFYVGVKIIEAWKQEKDGEPGYSVKYPDGYVSWSPKDAFEQAYLPMGLDPSKVNEKMVNEFIREVRSHGMEDGKTVFLSADLATGFVQYETSSCVDPLNLTIRSAKRCAWLESRTRFGSVSVLLSSGDDLD